MVTLGLLMGIKSRGCRIHFWGVMYMEGKEGKGRERKREEGKGREGKGRIQKDPLRNL